MAAELVNAVGEGINNALALTGSPPQLKIPASGSSADTNEVSVVGSPDKVVDLNAVGDGIDNSLSALNPFGTDQGNKQVGTDGENSGPQTALGRWRKLTPKSLTDGFKFTPLKPSASMRDNQTGGASAKVGTKVSDSLQQVANNVGTTVQKATDSVKGLNGLNGGHKVDSKVSPNSHPTASSAADHDGVSLRRKATGPERVNASRSTIPRSRSRR